MLTVRPISIREANEYVEKFHRHHGKKVGCRFTLGCYDGPTLHGVAICSNPVARNADDGLTLEVSRLCTDGTYNACSILYGACARVAKAMGFQKIQTYILQSESGTSLKASGWKCEGAAGAVSWMATPSERTKKRNAQLTLFSTGKSVPQEMKTRWSKEFI